MNKLYLGIGGILAAGGLYFVVKTNETNAANNAAAAQAAADAANNPYSSLSASGQYLGSNVAGAQSATDVNPYVYGSSTVNATGSQPVTGTSSGDAAIQALTAAITSQNSSNAGTTQAALNTQLAITQATNAQQTVTQSAQLAAQLIGAGNNVLSVGPSANGGFDVLSANTTGATFGNMNSNNNWNAQAQGNSISNLIQSNYAATHNLNSANLTAQAAAIPAAQKIAAQSTAVQNLVLH